MSTAAAPAPAIGAGATRQGEQAEDMTEAGAVTLESAERGFEDGLAVLGHVHEDEVEDSHREHRQGDAQAVIDAPDPPLRQAR
ncbi:MAG: hypothetical protein ABSG95_10160 [Solirubrobacteraceae bacterium]